MIKIQRFLRLQFWIASLVINSVAKLDSTLSLTFSRWGCGWNRQLWIESPSADIYNKYHATFLRSGRCTICQYVMGILDEALEGHMTKQKIISKIHQLCNKLPREIFKTECNAIIGEYGGELINLIVENYLKPKDACQHFGLCWKLWTGWGNGEYSGRKPPPCFDNS